MSRYIPTDTPFFRDDGTPNALGAVYFGDPGEDAKTNPKVPYLDEALTTPASATQALTAGGKLQQKLYLSGDYSVIVDDADGVQVDEDLNAAIISASAVSVTVNGLARDSVQSYLENKEVDDYVTLRSVDVSQISAGDTLSVNYRLISGDEGGGVFVWFDSDLSSEVAADSRSGIYVAPNLDATGASGAWVRRFIGCVQMSWFGMVSDWDGSSGTDNTTAAQAAVDYAYNNGVHEVEVSGGAYFITRIEVPSANNYSTAGMTLRGKGIRATTFYSDTSQAIRILPGDGSGGTVASYNVNLSDFSLRDGTINPTNGVYCSKLAFSTFHNINVSGFGRCFYLQNDSFINRFTKLYMSGTHDYGFRMDGSGTTNYWDQCFDFGASERAYKLTGDYSSIGAIAADECTGDYPYEFSFFSGDIASLGSEACDCLRMVSTANSNINIGYILAFGNTFDSSVSKGGAVRGTGSTLNINQIRVVQASTMAPGITGIAQAASNPQVTAASHGFSTGDTVFIDDVVGMTEINFQFDTITVTGTDTFTLDNIDTSSYTAYTSGGVATYSSTQSPIDMFESNVTCESVQTENCHFSGEPGGSSSESNTLRFASGGTPIAVGTEGTGRPYLGFDRGRLAFPDTDRRIEGTRAVPKAIFLDMDGSLRFDTDGNDYQNGRPARIGDVFLESKPADNHQFGRIVTGTGTTLSACTSSRVPLVLSGATASRPLSNLYAGLYYFDTTLGQPIWYDGSGWVDATGSSA